MKREAYALVLAGGGGTRLWPASRRQRPKQFVPFLPGGKTLLQATVERLRPVFPLERIFIVTAAEQVADIVRLLPDFPTAQIVSEPVARNTAACIGLGVVEVRRRHPDALVAVIPSDQFSSDAAGYERALHAALDVAQLGRVATVGIRPSRPETGFGYIRYRTGTELTPGGFAVEQFVEKPTLEMALEYISAGNYLWNSGMFFFSAAQFIDLVSLHAPDLHRALGEIAADARVTSERYAGLASISIDYALIEKLHPDQLGVVPADFGWSDVGAWAALGTLGRADSSNNVSIGDTVTVDAQNNILYADDGCVVAALGVSGLVIAVSHGAVLVLPRERAQEVRTVVEQLKAGGRGEFL